jgi:hypothetical protein
MSIGWPICSALSGRLMLATSYRTASVAGGALLVLGSAALVLLNPGRGMPWATVAAFLVGGGMGMSNSAFMVAIQSAADHSVRGIATASAVFSRMLGSSLGTAILGAVLNLSLAHGAAPYADPVQTLMESQAHGSVSPETLALLAGEVGLALHLVFIGGLMLACIALGVAWLMPGGTRPGDPSDAPRR